MQTGCGNIIKREQALEAIMDAEALLLAVEKDTIMPQNTKSMIAIAVHFARKARMEIEKDRKGEVNG